MENKYKNGRNKSFIRNKYIKYKRMNSPIINQRLENYIKKHDLTVCWLWEMYLI